MNEFRYFDLNLILMIITGIDGVEDSFIAIYDLFSYVFSSPMDAEVIGENWQKLRKHILKIHPKLKSIKANSSLYEEKIINGIQTKRPVQPNYNVWYAAQQKIFSESLPICPLGYTLFIHKGQMQIKKTVNQK